MISKEMNPTKTQSPMPNQRALWLAAVIPFLALVAQAQSVVNVAPFGSVQDAIDAAMPGDTLLMSAGTFEPTGTIVLNKDGLVLKGAGADATTIDISGFDAWAFSCPPTTFFSKASAWSVMPMRTDNSPFIRIPVQPTSRCVPCRFPATTGPVWTSTVWTAV